MRQFGRIVLALAVVALLAGPALAQDTPDATVVFSGGTVAVGIGWSWGSGTLTYQGKDYPFSVEGMSVGAVGGSSVTATGGVYNLKKLEDFNGNYTAATAGMTVGGGAAGTAMQNQQSVVIKIVSTNQGLDFKFAASGVKFTLK
jgi:hypothetical protein